MALKKSELYSSLWQSCDELRGGMDASQYKDYVLVLLFIKYVSDKYAGQPYAAITVPKGASFQDMVALKGKSDIGDKINKTIIQPLMDANKLSDFPDFNDATKLGSGKEMVGRLTNLVAIFENPALDFSKNRADGDDILGDAYEYLMRHFATESGKSKGQFYTPAEVSRIIAQILGIRDAKTSPSTTAYDPTCGSGSLLLKLADEATTRLTLNGQEKDAATSGLARMNMILHDSPEALIVQGNTLTDPKLKGLETGCLPKEVVAELSEGLLAHYDGKPLIDRYDVYQHLMDYWAETMQDDCYLISDDGWKAETSRILVKDKKGKEKDKGWVCDLVPKVLIVARYFAEEQTAIDGLSSELESTAARLGEMEEEHGGEDGAFGELEKVNKAGVAARLKEIKGDAEAKDEAAVLKEWLELSGEMAVLKKRVKEAEAELDVLVYGQYPELTEAEIKVLVVDDKWMAALDAAVHGEMDRVSQQLTQRVKELAERYETPMPEMAGRVAELGVKVNRHLERMGFSV